MDTKKCSRCGRELPITEFNWMEAALACGEIVRPDVCWGCGCRSDEHRIEAHHHGYTRPLDVTWLCTPCHRQMDARRRVHEGLKPYGRSK